MRDRILAILIILIALIFGYLNSDKLVYSYTMTFKDPHTVPPNQQSNVARIVTTSGTDVHRTSLIIPSITNPQGEPVIFVHVPTHFVLEDISATYDDVPLPRVTPISDEVGYVDHVDIRLYFITDNYSRNTADIIDINDLIVTQP